MKRFPVARRIGVVLVFAALLTLAVAQSTGEWEYLVVSYGAPSFAAPVADLRADLRADEASHSKLLRFATLGIALPQEAAGLQRNIDLLGRFGWELVTVVGSIEGDPRLVFKRPYDAERSEGEAERVEAERTELLAAYGATREPPRVGDATAPLLVDLDAVDQAEATTARNERDVATVRALIVSTVELGFPLSNLTIDARAFAPDAAADVRVRVEQDVTSAALVGPDEYRSSLALAAYAEFLGALERVGLPASEFAFCVAAEGIGTGTVQLAVDLVIHVADTQTIIATRRSTLCFVEP